MGIRVNYEKRLPNCYRKIVNRNLRLFLAGCPHWLQRVTFELCADDKMDGHKYCEVATSHEYRHATVILHPGILVLSKKEQERVLMHEVGHMHQAVICEAFESVLEWFDEDQRGAIKKIMKTSWEVNAEDFAQSILSIKKVVDKSSKR